MITFSIKDLESLTNIKAHTLRIWEQRYGLLKPIRTETNIRQYNSEHLNLLLDIVLLNEYGFKISRIAERSNSDLKATIDNIIANNIEAKHKHTGNQLLVCLSKLDWICFEETLRLQIKEIGIMQTIESIIMPHLKRITYLCHHTNINAAQEQIIANIIRNKIIVGIEEMPVPTSYAKIALLFMPDILKSRGEVGLLIIQYWLKMNNIKTIYAGPNASAEDIAAIAEKIKFDAIFCHTSCCSIRINFDKLLLQINNQKILLNKNFVLCGHFEKPQIKTQPNITTFNDFNDLHHYINNM